MDVGPRSDLLPQLTYLHAGGKGGRLWGQWWGCFSGSALPSRATRVHGAGLRAEREGEGGRQVRRWGTWGRGARHGAALLPQLTYFPPICCSASADEWGGPDRDRAADVGSGGEAGDVALGGGRHSCAMLALASLSGRVGSVQSFGALAGAGLTLGIAGMRRGQGCGGGEEVFGGVRARVLGRGCSE